MNQLAKDEVRRRIVEIGIVPVVRAPSADLAAAAARAVCAGGIPILEITMTVPSAIDVIRDLTTSMPDEILIGVGTVLDAETAQQCFDAGAQFLVSPIFDPESIKLARSRHKLTMAGGLTPNEVVAAWRAGADFVKVFPCGNVGGAGYIKALKSALPQIPMVPTGGVNLATATQFLAAGASAVGVGGELISTSAMQSGNFSAITEAAREFSGLIRNWRQRTSC
ncbi:MAG TPA: bifunctional 4-hydroxy-2-oxoglutarate aldolase/2-dehydro-3-deoxy-phosphogluconate aldolase [Bryobacteraceae bacterium]|jgi:2-dehydro-3-deoxyphosphogluconate aldolase/(4S)-4-hydroxy-2-oxoglutarate aldolase|nr:bifunctional 4-hydroxy-2-oxoglutarate aldolase/2-dehydro-3-deoxy-phosphogluconate aldolase [Bryobacteraceae bacterium]